MAMWIMSYLLVRDYKTLLSASLCFLLAFLVVRRSRSKGDVVHVPGPDGDHWLWGHELQTFGQEATNAYSMWLRHFGPVMKVKGALFHHDILVVADNIAVQHIFQHCYLYVKSPAFRRPIFNLLGEGIVWAEDEMHKQHRRILQPAFTTESIHGMAPAIIECATNLRERLTEHVHPSIISTINILKWTSATTLDIIGKIGFGHDFQFGDSDEAKAISSTWHKHVNEGIQLVGFIAPLILRTFPFVAHLPIQPIRAQGKIKVIVNRLSRAMLRNETARVAAGENKGQDILSILMRENSQDACALPEGHVIDNISTFVMVGHETTSSALGFALLSLASNLHVQSKLRTEVCKAATCSDYLAYNQIVKLSYLDAVTKESMRLHPASPQTERVALKDDVIPLRVPIRTSSGKLLTSLHIKAHQVIHIPFMSMHKMPSVWGDDAEMFRPERWIEENALPPIAERPHGWSGLVTFCDGPRNCLGYKLAIYEFKVILAILVQHFKFEPTSADIKRRISPTLQPVVDGEAGILPLNVSLV